MIAAWLRFSVVNILFASWFLIQIGFIGYSSNSVRCLVNLLWMSRPPRCAPVYPTLYDDGTLRYVNNWLIPD
jgi:hypothetical protein